MVVVYCSGYCALWCSEVWSFFLVVHGHILKTHPTSSYLQVENNVKC